MSAPKTALMTVTSDNGAPSLDAAAAQLGISVSGLNPDFGVVLVDPDQGLYCVEVFADSLPAPAPEGESFRGPYANPEIGPAAG